MLNFDKIKERNLKIQNIRLEAYRNILSMVIKTIELKALENKDFCLYEMPEFVIGDINYNITDCSNYIITELSKDKNIIDISFYKPNIIYIKWTIN